jgi:hypothetical protein
MHVSLLRREQHGFGIGWQCRRRERRGRRHRYGWRCTDLPGRARGPNQRVRGRGWLGPGGAAGVRAQHEGRQVLGRDGLVLVAGTGGSEPRRQEGNRRALLQPVRIRQRGQHTRHYQTSWETVGPRSLPPSTTARSTRSAPMRRSCGATTTPRARPRPLLPSQWWWT